MKEIDKLKKYLIEYDIESKVSDNLAEYGYDKTVHWLITWGFDSREAEKITSHYQL